MKKYQKKYIYIFYSCTILIKCKFIIERAAKKEREKTIDRES